MTWDIYFFFVIINFEDMTKTNGAKPDSLGVVLLTDLVEGCLCRDVLVLGFDLLGNGQLYDSSEVGQSAVFSRIYNLAQILPLQQTFCIRKYSRQSEDCRVGGCP